MREIWFMEPYDRAHGSWTDPIHCMWYVPVPALCHACSMQSRPGATGIASRTGGRSVKSVWAEPGAACSIGCWSRAWACTWHPPRLPLRALALESCNLGASQAAHTHDRPSVVCEMLSPVHVPQTAQGPEQGWCAQCTMCGLDLASGTLHSAQGFGSNLASRLTQQPSCSPPDWRR